MPPLSAAGLASFCSGLAAAARSGADAGADADASADAGSLNGQPEIIIARTTL